MSDGNSYSYNLFYNILFMSHSGLQLPRSFACFVSDLCVRIIRWGWRKGWLNQKLPPEINNLNAFFKNAEKSYLPLFSHDQGHKTGYHVKSSNYLTVLHRKFIVPIPCVNNTSHNTLSPAPYRICSSKRISPHNGSICAWPDLLLCKCIAAASVNETGDYVRKVFQTSVLLLLLLLLFSCSCWNINLLTAVSVTEADDIAMLVTGNWYAVKLP